VIPVLGSSIVGALKVNVSCCEDDSDGESGSSPAIGVLGLIGGLLHVLKLQELGFVRKTEFFEDDGNLPWVRATGVGVEGDCLCHDGRREFGCGYNRLWRVYGTGIP